jgi:hypothetical protein
VINLFHCFLILQDCPLPGILKCFYDNVFGKSINFLMQNTKTLFDISKSVGEEINSDETVSTVVYFIACSSEVVCGEAGCYL